MDLFPIDDPEKERIRQRTLDMDAIRDEFSDSDTNSKPYTDPLIEADRKAILDDLNNSLSDLPEGA